MTSDQITLAFNIAVRKITSFSINAYRVETKDAVTLQVQLASLPDRANCAPHSSINTSA